MSRFELEQLGINPDTTPVDTAFEDEGSMLTLGFRMIYPEGERDE